MCVCLALYVCLFVCLALYVCLFVCLALYVCLFVSQSVSVAACASVCLSVHSSISNIIRICLLFYLFYFSWWYCVHSVFPVMAAGYSLSLSPRAGCGSVEMLFRYLPLLNIVVMQATPTLQAQQVVSCR